MVDRVKYLVQVQCEPSPVAYQEQIVQVLSDGFSVPKSSFTSSGFTLEIRADHPLAYGVFKDVADLVKATLTQRNLRLLSGVIHRVERNSLSAAVDAFIFGNGNGIKGTGNGAFSFLASMPFQKFVHGLLGGTRLVPEMYFYGEVHLDLVLSDKARRLAMRAAAEAN